MNSTDLLARARDSAVIEDSNVDWGTGVAGTLALFNVMNEQFWQLFGRAIIKSKQGYWLKSYTFVPTVGQPNYRLSSRISIGGMDRIQLATDANLDFCDIDEVDEAQGQYYDQGINTRGQPCRYLIRGEQLKLLPYPDGGAYTARVLYYIRPSRLVPTQTAGAVTAVNTTARTITVNSVPLAYDSTNTGTAITSGVQSLDVVGAGGWHELQLVGATQTLSATTFTITDATLDMSTIAVGDFVRAADQTDTLAIPDEFHRAVADSAAMKILTLRSMDAKAESLASNIAPAVAQMNDMLSPRVKTQAKVISAPPYIRGMRRGWQVKYP